MKKAATVDCSRSHAVSHHWTAAGHMQSHCSRSLLWTVAIVLQREPLLWTAAGHTKRASGVYYSRSHIQKATGVDCSRSHIQKATGVDCSRSHPFKGADESRALFSQQCQFEDP